MILEFQKINIILKYTICIRVFLNSKLVNVTCIEFNKDKQFSCIVSSNQEKRQNIQTYLSIHQFHVYPSYYLSKFILFACVLKQPTRTHVCHPIFHNTKYLKTNMILTSWMIWKGIVWLDILTIQISYRSIFQNSCTCTFFLHEWVDNKGGHLVSNM